MPPTKQSRTAEEVKEANRAKARRWYERNAQQYNRNRRARRRRIKRQEQKAIALKEQAQFSARPIAVPSPYVRQPIKEVQAELLLERFAFLKQEYRKLTNDNVYAFMDKICQNYFDMIYDHGDKYGMACITNPRKKVLDIHRRAQRLYRELCFAVRFGKRLYAPRAFMIKLTMLDGWLAELEKTARCADNVIKTYLKFAFTWQLDNRDEEEEEEEY